MFVTTPIVGVGDQNVAVAQARVGAKRVDLAADDDRWVQSCGAQHGRDKRRCRGFSVRSGDRDAVLQAHQLGEHLGALDDGDVARARFEELGVVAGDGARDDQHVGVADVARAMPDVDLHAELLEPPRDVGSLQIRA